MKTLQDFITFKGSNAVTDAQLKLFGLDRKQLTSGWLKRLKNTPVKDEESWNNLVDSLKPNSVTKSKNKQRVYIIKNCIGDYKIGISSDVRGRLTELLVANSEPLEVIRVYRVNTPRRSESSLHERYKSIWKRGEWFSSELDLQDVDSFVSSSLRGTVEYSNNMDRVWIVS